ncbi:MAG: hypothetical protein F6J93_23750 [Oscillatoria sp. SIO1A7]|nr:hypothetical protein [Oscillatoria sp. SIO1A7]
MGTHFGWTREWLYWYDQDGNRYATPEERAQQADLAEERLEYLNARLQEMGINPDNL